MASMLTRGSTLERSTEWMTARQAGSRRAAPSTWRSRRSTRRHRVAHVRRFKVILGTSRAEVSNLVEPPEPGGLAHFRVGRLWIIDVTHMVAHRTATCFHARSTTHSSPRTRSRCVPTSRLPLQAHRQQGASCTLRLSSHDSSVCGRGRGKLAVANTGHSESQDPRPPPLASAPQHASTCKHTGHFPLSLT